MLLAGSLMAFTGCKDDGKDSGKDVSIIGTWQYDTSVEYTTVDGEVRVGPDTYDYTDENASVIFKEDKTFQSIWQGTVEAQGKYSYSNGKIHFVYDDGTEDDVTVKTLTDNSLIVVWEDDDSVNGKVIIEVVEDHFSR